MYLLFYTQPDDLVVGALAKLPELSNERVVLCDVKKFLDEVEVNDEIIDGKAIIRWTFADGSLISSEDDVKVINRCGFLASENFADFQSEDKDYAASETHAYLGFAFNSFRKCFNRPNADGNGIKDQARLIQWTRVKRIFTEIDCPNYFLGPYRFSPIDLSGYIVHPCDGSINDQNAKNDDWLGHKPADSNSIVFAYEKIEGATLTVNRVGDAVFWGWGVSGSDVQEQVKELAFKNTALILDAFGVDIGSVYWTVGPNGKLTFQYASSWLSYSEGANEMIRDGIENYFKPESLN